MYSMEDREWMGGGGVFFFIMGRWSKKEGSVGSKKSIPPHTHTRTSGVAVRPCISFNPFSTPPSISFHSTYQRHS